MLNLARSLTNQKLINFKPKSVHSDNLIFRFHYRLTVLILLIGVALLSSKEYIGENISCIHGDSKLGDVINRYCFFMSTFTVVKHQNRSMANREIAHPGVGPHVESDRDQIVRHTYYQWVIFVLFLQAISFYTPHVIWRNMEKGELERLAEGIGELDVIKAENKIKSIGKIEMHLKKRIYLNRSWSTCLIFCEILNLLNLILQIYLTNAFLGYQFWDLGKKVYWDKRGDEFNPLDVVFPKVTKCSFRKFGPSGTIQFHDIMCIMALNIVNEKIYTVLWFWYIVLFALSVWILVWRVLSYFFKNSISFNEYVFDFAAATRLNKRDLKIVAEASTYGEWMFLSYLAGTMKGRLFNDLLAQLAESHGENRREIFQTEMMAVEKLEKYSLGLSPPTGFEGKGKSRVPETLPDEKLDKPLGDRLREAEPEVTDPWRITEKKEELEKPLMELL